VLTPLKIFADIIGWFPHYKADVILDVGAHKGDFSNAYAKAWPDAYIAAFEPHPQTAWALRGSVPDFVKVYPFALSNHTGTIRMTDIPGSSGNRVTAEGELEIDCFRGDEFLSNNNIEHVSLLKIDAEAHDVQVLRGFGDRLQDVDFVQVETMLNRHDPQGSMYADVYDYMTSQGFYVFNLYEFLWEWRRGVIPIKVQLGNEVKKMPGAPIARRVDTAYINPKLVELTI
jgi:FkbM family methyltransferase